MKTALISKNVYSPLSLPVLSTEMPAKGVNIFVFNSLHRAPAGPYLVIVLLGGDFSSAKKGRTEYCGASLITTALKADLENQLHGKLQLPR
jgi:hypothetical protein